jgi:hypothetical protein
LAALFRRTRFTAHLANNAREATLLARTMPRGRIRIVRAMIAGRGISLAALRRAVAQRVPRLQCRMLK